jgi:hypothetical protein
MRAPALCRRHPPWARFAVPCSWQTINAGDLRGFLCRGTERPQPSFSRCTDMVAALERLFQSIPLSMHFILSDARTNGLAVAVERGAPAPAGPFY